MKPNTKWADLPNAHHIDWVLRSLKKDPGLWAAASGAARDVASGAAWYAARLAARLAASGAARDVAWYAAKGAARDAAGTAAWDVAWAVAGTAASVSVLALIVYDDCDEYLTMSYEELRIWAALSEHPAAVLLQPMTYVRDKMHEPALV